MRTPEDINRFISAEIPDKELDKYLYEVVSDVMIHGPCGIHHRENVCMNNGKCTKFFPKPFMEKTVVDDAGYPIYKRRQDGRFVQKRDMSPHVKQLGEYWLLRFSFHLPGQELVVYNEDDPIADVMKRSARGSKLLAWMECNKKYPEGRSLTHAEFPNMFVWVKSKRIWQPRSKKRKSFAVARVTYVPPSIGQAYYLRVILNIVPGATSFEFLKTVKDGFVMDNNENRLLIDERNFKRDEQVKNYDRLLRMATDEQKSVYLEIINAVNRNKGGMFFVHGFGGTGKTFLWSILGADIRSRGDIVLNVASSGIVALLMEGGRTAHSRFSIPIHVDEYTTCSIDVNSHLAELIREARLIIWDEAPMMNKYCFETLDRSLRDIMKCDRVFGGKVFVLGGDFRQILPVVPEAGRVGTVLASINSSLLWNSCKVLQLTQNMRLRKAQNSIDANDLTTFSKWLLDIGDGKINKPYNGEVEIDIPKDLLITEFDNPIQAIVKEIYGTSFATRTDAKFFCERDILGPRNDDVNKINQYMLSQIPGEERQYLSSDSVETSDTSDYDDMTYTQEFLNSIQVSGLPNHVLTLKKRAPIMLLRNIDPERGLCNGRRLIVTQMANHVIKARIVTGKKNVNDRVLIPRMFVSLPDAKFPFRMRRRQFPVALAFAITINKSQDVCVCIMDVEDRRKLVSIIDNDEVVLYEWQV
ncbi:PREDICTED: ATP-dependent DNA helicase PIF1-like [Camelina sativa]|uniref:ATP-dependent DNA helicase n=1 Tax=Camelina sativa TaxID=90675 RepID=A0ABM0XEZ9_CAMSA|nr:PREDICTED: ATP-dependent DNA helicase PIF1-like [Camelina sativa]